MTLSVSDPIAIRSLPLQERLRLQKNGFESYHIKDGRDDGKKDCVDSQIPSDGKASKKAFTTRVSKNHPIEVTSKRPVPRFRQVIEVKAKRAHDPRFDPLCGKLNQDLFEKSYAFIHDHKENEINLLRKQLKKVKNITAKEKLQLQLKQLTQELAEAKKHEKVKNALLKRKRQEKDAVVKGKKPFYMKRKDKKQVELEVKFQDLQESGKLSKFMAKKRKKNANKDHRWLPRKT